MLGIGFMTDSHPLLSYEVSISTVSKLLPTFPDSTYLQWLSALIVAGFFLLGMYSIGDTEPTKQSSQTQQQSPTKKTESYEGKVPGIPPFWQKRADAAGLIPRSAWKEALLQARTARNAKLEQAKSLDKDSCLWQLVGPTNIGGRITDVESPTYDPNTIYVAAASGGVFKSNNAGKDWTPIFDEQLSLSIGDLAVAPSDSNVIYVGTGEPNAGGGSITYDGIGVFRSDDAGNTWRHLGLDDSRNIGKVIVDAFNPDIVYVAAMGGLFHEGDATDRGVYRSKNGGQSWELVHYVSDSTGCIDLAIHPYKPDRVFAAMWERKRTPDHRQYGGKTSAIYRSDDGGDIWARLNNGLPEKEMGRIGIAIAPSDPEIVYAVFADSIGYFAGVYKSTDGGDQWQRIDQDVPESIYRSYGWWFGGIEVDPMDPEKVYLLGLDIHVSKNGGANWENISYSKIHYDQHALFIDPTDPSRMLSGNDGGLYWSSDTGKTWAHYTNLPITQFYTCEINPRDPDQLFGGTQDNGVIGLTGVDSSGQKIWQQILDGDGFGVRVDPYDDRYLYAEYQYGNFHRSIDAGQNLIVCDITADTTARFNWRTPFELDPKDPSVLYIGAERLYRSDNRAESWRPISPDLSGGAGLGNLTYGTITAIAIAESNPNFIYVGTDDGKVWLTKNGGAKWDFIDYDLPPRWVSSIDVHATDPRIAYISFSGYRNAERQAYVYKTNNAGKSWNNIATDLPTAPVNEILIDPLDETTLYAATDVGVFERQMGEIGWEMVGFNLPNVPVTDLSIHHNTRTLAAATYGRSMYTFPLGGCNFDD